MDKYSVPYKNDLDDSRGWRAPPSLAFSGMSRFRSWLSPILSALVVVVLVIVLIVTNVKASSRQSTVEQRVSDLSDIITSLNASLQEAQGAATDVHRLKADMKDVQQQLDSASVALQQMSVLDSLTKTVSSIKCSLDHIINNSSIGDGCCPLGWTQFTTNCYFFSTSSLSWNQSKAWCETHNAHLVILMTDKEWDFVTRLSVHNQYWIGLSDSRTGRWEWVNNSPYIMERRRWRPGQPDAWTGHGLGPGDEDCAHLYIDGRLNDLHCSKPLRYICQTRSLQV